MNLEIWKVIKKNNPKKEAMKFKFPEMLCHARSNHHWRLNWTGDFRKRKNKT